MQSSNEGLITIDVPAPTGSDDGRQANAETIGWVETFVPKSGGEHYLPHVTSGVASEAFVKQLKGLPFEAFSFKPADVAVYQLGNFGTASKMLWQSSVK